jgi:hypothetical protein
MRALVASVLLLLCTTAAARARGDAVTARDGAVYSGKVVALTRVFVSIRTETRVEVFPLGQVRAIERDQGEDAVTLADGSTHRGAIVDAAWGDHVTLFLAGEQVTYEWANVASCQQATAAGAPSTQTETQASEGASPAPDLQVDAHGAKLTASGPLVDAEARRQAWLDRGGSLMGYDASASLTYFAASTNGATLQGFGGGSAMHATYYYLDPPDAASGASTWLGLRLGAGMEASEIIVTGSSGGQSASGAIYTVVLPATLGAQVGLGDFDEEGAWKGVMLGVDYKPSYQYVGVSQIGGAGAFNPVGVQATFDFVDMHAVREKLEEQLKEAQWRLTVVALPPAPPLPLLVTAALGVVWY